MPIMANRKNNKVRKKNERKFILCCGMDYYDSIHRYNDCGDCMMRIKDAYGIYRDTQVPIDSERTLYQKGQIKYGFFDIYGSTYNLQGRAESKTRS